MVFRAIRLLVYAWLLTALAPSVWAAEDQEREAAEAAPGAPPEERSAEAPPAINQAAIYIPLAPAFVVNYGGEGRLKYIRADISLRLRDSVAANSVRHHLPYIRNNLIMLLSAQTEESISSQEGKEALRQEALQTVKDVLLQEDQVEGVVDLYFNAFLIQK